MIIHGIVILGFLGVGGLRFLRWQRSASIVLQQCHLVSRVEPQVVSDAVPREILHQCPSCTRGRSNARATGRPNTIPATDRITSSPDLNSTLCILRHNVIPQDTPAMLHHHNATSTSLVNVIRHDNRVRMHVDENRSIKIAQHMVVLQLSGAVCCQETSAVSIVPNHIVPNPRFSVCGNTQSTHKVSIDFVVREGSTSSRVHKNTVRPVASQYIP
mmetsp:Transcript_4016/g.9873  ORF Transcript_4016/g.9873 Transcript_4016/m.9873 type:complete len:215 (-) Transcript_4016:129-773(-)